MSCAEASRPEQWAWANAQERRKIISMRFDFVMSHPGQVRQNVSSCKAGLSGPALGHL